MKPVSRYQLLLGLLGLVMVPQALGQSGSWSPLGDGVNLVVEDLALDASGRLYAAGGAEGSEPNYMMRWDGAEWETLDGEMSLIVRALAADQSGNVYAGGDFSFINGALVSFVARFDGTAWHPLGSGVGDPVNALAIDGAGVLYAGGHFSTAGGSPALYVARWDGAEWSPLGSGPGGAVSDLVIDDHGNVYAGVFSNETDNPIQVARWDGDEWTYLGEGMTGGSAYGIRALAVDGLGNLYAGGHFDAADGIPAQNVARWDGTSWAAVGDGLSGIVWSLAADASGRVYAGGLYPLSVAEWNGSAWTSIGGPEIPVFVEALLLDGLGNLFAGGAFSTLSGVSANNVARWDGAASTDAESGGDVPKSFRLSAAYPNPFNPETRFTLSVEATQWVSVRVVDVLGRTVARLYDGILALGEHPFRWSAHGVPSGIYLIRAQGVGPGEVTKVSLLR